MSSPARPMSVKDAERLRRRFRRRLFKSGARPSLSRVEYARRIRTHHATLLKYMGGLGKYLSDWASRNPWNFLRAWWVLGGRRMALIETAPAGYPEATINEVFELWWRIGSIRRDYAHYVLNKTHLSYSVNGSAPDPRVDRKDYGDGTYSKFAEFVNLIVAEYVVLHNYIWASGMRPRGVTSIDRFLRPIRGSSGW